MVNQKEVEDVSALQPFDRYTYFIKKIADYEEFWLLKDEYGTLALSEVEGNTLLSFWSAKEFTTSCLNNEWKEYKAINVSLAEFEIDLLPFLNEKEILIDVFPVNNRAGFVVTAEEFVRDFNIELDNYE